MTCFSSILVKRNHIFHPSGNVRCDAEQDDGHDHNILQCSNAQEWSWPALRLRGLLSTQGKCSKICQEEIVRFNQDGVPWYRVKCGDGEWFSGDDISAYDFSAYDVYGVEYELDSK